MHEEGRHVLVGCVDIAFEDEVRFVNLLKSAWFLSYGGG